MLAKGCVYFFQVTDHLLPPPLVSIKWPLPNKPPMVYGVLSKLTSIWRKCIRPWVELAEINGFLDNTVQVCS